MQAPPGFPERQLAPQDAIITSTLGLSKNKGGSRAERDRRPATNGQEPGSTIRRAKLLTMSFRAVPIVLSRVRPPYRVVTRTREGKMLLDPSPPVNGLRYFSRAPFGSHTTPCCRTNRPTQADQHQPRPHLAPASSFLPTSQRSSRSKSACRFHRKGPLEKCPSRPAAAASYLPSNPPQLPLRQRRGQPFKEPQVPRQQPRDY